jgi:hypothetical protein
VGRLLQELTVRIGRRKTHRHHHLRRVVRVHEVQLGVARRGGVGRPTQRTIGRVRPVDTDDDSPMALSRPPGRDHGDWARRMLHTVLAHRSEQEPGEPAPSSSADHEQISAFRSFEQRLGSEVADEHGSRVGGDMPAPGQTGQRRHRPVEDLGAARFEGCGIGEVIGGIERVRRDPGMHDFERGRTPRRFRRSPLQCPLRRG